jgi:hypothetical protein
MRVTVIIDPADDQYDTMLYDIQTFLHFQTRGSWTINEKKDCDRRAVLTIDFRDPSDEHNFRCVSNIAPNISRRSRTVITTQRCRIIGKQLGGVRLRARELVCAIANEPIAAADVTECPIQSAGRLKTAIAVFQPFPACLAPSGTSRVWTHTATATRNTALCDAIAMLSLPLALPLTRKIPLAI